MIELAELIPTFLYCKFTRFYAVQSCHLKAPKHPRWNYQPSETNPGSLVDLHVPPWRTRPVLAVSAPAELGSTKWFSSTRSWQYTLFMFFSPVSHSQHHWTKLHFNHSPDRKSNPTVYNKSSETQSRLSWNIWAALRGCLPSSNGFFW